MKTKKNIIFDFDGVIADTEFSRFSILAKILIQFEINIEKNHEISDLAGIPTDIFLAREFPQLHKEEIAKIVALRREKYLNDLNKYCKAFPKAIKTIKDLKNEGYRLFLATTSESHIVKPLLINFEIEDYFLNKFYRENIENPKTGSKDYSLLFSSLDIQTEDCIIIEDSLTGVTSAKECNVFCIAFNRYNNSKIHNKADISIQSYVELRAFFDL